MFVSLLSSDCGCDALCSAELRSIHYHYIMDCTTLFCAVLYSAVSSCTESCLSAPYFAVSLGSLLGANRQSADPACILPVELLREANTSALLALTGMPKRPYLAAGNPVPVLPGMAHGKALVGPVHHLAPQPQPALLLRPAVPTLQQACAVPLPAFVCMWLLHYCVPV